MVGASNASTSSITQTVVVYAPGKLREAKVVATRLHLPPPVALADATGVAAAPAGGDRDPARLRRASGRRRLRSLAGFGARRRKPVRGPSPDRHRRAHADDRPCDRARPRGRRGREDPRRREPRPHLDRRLRLPGGGARARGARHRALDEPDVGGAGGVRRAPDARRPLPGRADHPDRDAGRRPARRRAGLPPAARAKPDDPRPEPALQAGAEGAGRGQAGAGPRVRRGRPVRERRRRHAHRPLPHALSDVRAAGHVTGGCCRCSRRNRPAGCAWWPPT